MTRHGGQVPAQSNVGAPGGAPVTM